jgi:putative DNA primase/helicase
MARRTRDEKIERLTAASREKLERIKSRALRWAIDNIDAMKGANPELPEKLGDREMDNWRPLVTIADLAGGSWPKRARETAELFSEHSDDESMGAQLLADIHDLFEERNADQLRSRDIIEWLVGLEERPWRTWARGRELTVNGLARLLAPFGAKSTDIWIDGRSAKGYRRDRFEDAWKRYLPSTTPPQSARPRDLNDHADPERFQGAREQPGLAPGNAPEPAPDKDSRTLAVAPGGREPTQTEPAPPGKPNGRDLKAERDARLAALGYPPEKRKPMVIEGPDGRKIPYGEVPPEKETPS